MDRAKLDELIARLASGATRRTAVKGLFGGALASVGALAESTAKGKGKKKRKGHGKAGKKRGKGKGRGKNDGGQAEGQGADVGTEARSQAKAKSAKSKRCKKNGRNCRERAAGDQQLSAV
jgi:hypothetical protein